MTYLAGGEPFSFGPDGGPGALVLHGFTGSPFEVRALGELLHENGFGVIGPALPGHATHESDLAQIGAQDYIDGAERAFEEARRRFSRVYLLGLSLGGALSLYLSTRHTVSGVVCFSTPVFLDPFVAGAVPFLNRFVPTLRTPANFAAWQGNVVGYTTVPVNAAPPVLEVLAMAKDILPKVRAPLLIVQSKADPTSPARNAEYIRDTVGSADVRVVMLDGHDHLITVRPRLQRFAPAVLDFLKGLDMKTA